jgi:segregation and condensation protein B
MLEAILFASGEPVDKKRLAALIGVSSDSLAKAVAALRENLENRGLALIETEKDLELRTAPAASDIIKKLREAELARDLGKAGLETLAIILYRGGATRGEIDWVRGVNSSQTLRSLLLRGLVEKGESEDKRRPKYLPTIEALAHLGVGSASELPQYNELSAALSEKEAATS